MGRFVSVVSGAHPDDVGGIRFRWPVFVPGLWVIAAIAVLRCWFAGHRLTTHRVTRKMPALGARECENEPVTYTVTKTTCHDCEAARLDRALRGAA